MICHTNVTSGYNESGEVPDSKDVDIGGVLRLSGEKGDSTILDHSQSHERDGTKILLILLEVASRTVLGQYRRPVDRKR